MTVIARNGPVENFAFATFIAEFALVEIIAINAVSRVEDAIPVVAIFAAQSPDDHVAIPILRGVVGVGAVLALRIDDGEFGDGNVEFVKLFEEGAGEIVFAAVFQGVKTVRPPYRLIKNFIH